MNGFPAHMWEPERTNQETEQAIRILRWMDKRLWHKISSNERYARRYPVFRNVISYPAMTNRVRLFHGGPLVSVGIQVPVSGEGDEKHGHTRVRAIIVLVQEAILDGTIEESFARELMELLRGYFSAEYNVLERYIAARRVEEENDNKD